MLKPILLLGVFGAGVAVGVIAMRNYYGTSNPASTTPAAQAAAEISATLVETPESRVPATPLSAVSLPGNSAATATLPVPTAPAGVPPSVEAVDDGVVLQPIDAGPVFSKMIARASVPGNENQIGDAHRALERETRDEGWAYTMEAELQNTMVNEMSTSSFKAEHIECRATLCEVRLSGTGPQQSAAIKRWNESFIGQSPLGQRLFLNFASSISDNDRTDTLLIFRKPPPPGSVPPAPPNQAPQKRG